MSNLETIYELYIYTCDCANFGICILAPMKSTMYSVTLLFDSTLAHVNFTQFLMHCVKYINISFRRNLDLSCT